MNGCGKCNRSEAGGDEQSCFCLDVSCRQSHGADQSSFCGHRSERLALAPGDDSAALMNMVYQNMVDGP
jgi:hypothetical protein